MPAPEKANQKFYLGDGVYIELQPHALKLTTENGIRTTNTIYLEDEVILALLKHLGRLCSKTRLVEIIKGA